MKMKKAIVVIAMLAMAIILAAVLAICTASAEDRVTMYVICTDSYVNVREAPSTKAHIGGRMDFGWEVTVTGTARDRSGTDWYKVDGITEMGYGYICANYLVPSIPERVDLDARVNASGRVAVYKRVNGDRKTWVKPGSELKIKIYSDPWCLTSKGWIRTEYLEVIP
jgi:hypothetical protein